MPAFHDPRIAIVQAPQDYRDAGQSAFKAMCYAEYRGFFHIGMITRNERNAIIQHGTMTMVRGRAAASACGWAEWCITEDAELGLRLFERGFDAIYVPDSFGRGLMPDTFIDYKKQRFRWAYGAMQILKAHARALFLEGGPLSPGQRYHFVAGWLPWFADGCNLLFNLAALGWSAAMVWAPGEVDPPLVMYSVLPLSLFTFKLAKLVHLYRVRVGANLRQTLAAAVAGLRRSRTPSASAAVKGLLTRNEPFFRTPKRATRFRVLRRARRRARRDADDGGPAALGLGGGPRQHAAERGSRPLAWVIVLLIQSVPYASSLIVSLASAFPLPARLARHQLPPLVAGAPAAVAPGKPPERTRRPELCAKGRLRAMVSMIVAVAVFAGMDALLKELSTRYPPCKSPCCAVPPRSPSCCCRCCSATAARSSSRGASGCICCAGRCRRSCSAASSTPCASSRSPMSTRCSSRLPSS